MLMKLRTELLLVLGLIAGAPAGLSYAVNIDPNEEGSQYAYGGNAGWVNFEPSPCVTGVL
jgi:hypothetical protein